MSTTVTIGNLPAGTTLEEVSAELAEMGAPVLGLQPVEGLNPDKLAFAVELDIDHHTARLMIDRRRDRYFKGRKITVFISHVGD